MTTAEPTEQDHLRAKMLNACYDLGRLGLNPDDERTANALGRLVAFASQLGDTVDRNALAAATARITALEAALDDLLDGIDEDLNHPDLKGPTARLDAIAQRTAAARTARSAT